MSPVIERLQSEKRTHILWSRITLFIGMAVRSQGKETYKAIIKSMSPKVIQLSNEIIQLSRYPAKIPGSPHCLGIPPDVLCALPLSDSLCASVPLCPCVPVSQYLSAAVTQGSAQAAARAAGCLASGHGREVAVHPVFVRYLLQST